MRTSRFAAGAAIAAALVVAAAGGAIATYAFLTSRQSSTASRAATLQVLPPPNLSFEDIVFSPDGRHLAFVAADTAGKTQLWIRSIDSIGARALRETDGARYPFWSPDSRSIGFFADGKLKRVSVAGGSPQTLCTLPAARGGPRGGSWSSTGVILFGEWEFRPSPLYQVAESGGEPRALTTLEDSSSQSFHWWPTFLPDGRHFLYFVVNSVHSDATGVYVGALDQRNARLLMRAPAAATFARVSSSVGSVLYVEQGTLKARALDLGTLRLTGDAASIADGVSIDPTTYQTKASASESGALVYGGGTGLTQLRWFDRKGKELARLGAPGFHIDLRISPDGGRVATQREDTLGRADIWLVDETRSSRFTFTPEYHAAPVWHPDGSRIAFFAGKPWQIRTKPTSGAGDETVLAKSATDLVPSDWSPDGRSLMYAEAYATGADLWTMPATGGGKGSPVVRTDADENFGRFSADGRWVVYQSNQSGAYEIYVRPFPTQDTGAGGTLVSAGGGTQPRWPRHGQEIFYVTPDNMLMAVEVNVGATFRAGRPRALFRLRPAGVAWYDVSADGQRVLVAKPVSDGISAPATVVLNWFDGVRSDRRRE